MTKPLIKIYNCETNETIEREMNAQEYAQYELDQLAAVQLKAAMETKTAAQTAAQAKLEALGLTADDLKALGL